MLRDIARYLMEHNMVHIGVRAFLSFFIFLGVILILRPLIKGSWFKKKKEEFDLKGIRYEGKRHVWDFMDNALGHWFDDTYYYSRIGNKIQKNKKLSFIDNSLKYFIFSLVVSFVILILNIVIFKDALSGLFGFLLGFLFLYGYLFLLRTKNNREVGNEIVLFLNLMGNYSTANTEIMSVFMQVAPHLRSVLSEALVECVAESQKSTEYALNNLFNKIENRKFREILKSIMVSQKYSGSFMGTVADNRNNINSYVINQKRLKSLVFENSISMAVCSVVLMIIVYVLGLIIEENLFTVLILTSLGRVVLAIYIIGIMYFIKKMVEINV